MRTLDEDTRIFSFFFSSSSKYVFLCKLSLVVMHLMPLLSTVPDYKCPNLSITFTADRNNVTGSANITVTNLFRSHWKSLAGVKSFLPLLHKGNIPIGFSGIIPVKVSHI